MSIKYNYEIVSVDAVNRCMEVRYTADGHKEINISTRLPFEDELLESVIREFAPIPLWISLKTPVIVPEIGVSGTVTPVNTNSIAYPSTTSTFTVNEVTV